MAVDLHTDQIQGYFDGPVDHLFALPLLVDYIRAEYDPSRLTVVSPDAGRVQVADRWTDRLDTPLAIVHKRRDPNIANTVSVHEIVGDIKGRVCVLVDDMIDTAGTICAAAEALFENGAAEVIIAATHAVLSDPAVDRLKNSRVSEVIFTDTLPTRARSGLRQDDGAVDRADRGPGDPRGVRGRLGHLDVRGLQRLRGGGDQGHAALACSGRLQCVARRGGAAHRPTP